VKRREEKEKIHPFLPPLQSPPPQKKQKENKQEADRTDEKFIRSAADSFA